MKKSFRYSFALCCGVFVVLRFYIRQKIFCHRIPNFQEVHRSILLRGGKPTASGLAQLAEQGIKAVIDLRKRCIFPRKKHRSIVTFHIPFSPYKPTDQIVVRFLKILNNPLYYPVYVHCFHGADRTGTLCAIYRIVCQNWDKEKAIAEMKLRGHHWWHSNLIEYIRNLDVSRIRSQITC